MNTPPDYEAFLKSREQYRTIIALVADEIWLRNGGNQAYCTVLTPQRLKIK